VDDYVNVSDDISLEFGDGTNDKPFSISAWINLKNFSVPHVIVGKYDDGYTSGRTYNLIYSGSQIYINTYDDSVSAYRGRAAPFASADYQDKWTHVVTTYNGNKANSGFKIYINGLQSDNADSSGGSYTAMEDSSIPVTIQD
jgi:hypothetical protein